LFVFISKIVFSLQEEFEKKYSQTATGASQCSPLDLIEKERLRNRCWNRCWYETAGGKYRKRIYRIGNVSMMKVLRASCTIHKQALAIKLVLKR